MYTQSVRSWKFSLIEHLHLFIIFKKNSKVFEQKGDLLNFKANIDPRAVLSRVKLGWSKSSWVELSQDEFEQAEPSWAKQSPEPT